MKLFADLYSQLDGTTKTARKVAALVDFFRGCDPASGAWGVWCLGGLVSVGPKAEAAGSRAVPAGVLLSHRPD